MSSIRKPPLALSLGSLALLLATSAYAQELQPANSLELVPETAAIYLASMNHQARYKAVVESRAWKNVMDTAIARRMRAALRSGRRRGWDQFGENNPFAQFLEGYSESIGSAPGTIALGIVKQIVGNEVFIYADEDVLDFSDAFNRVYYGAIASMNLRGGAPGGGGPDAEKVADLIREHFTDVDFPTIVIGAIVDEPGQVQALLGTAELGIDQALNNLPREFDKLFEAFDVIDEDDLYCLHFRINEEVLPWDEMTSEPDIAPIAEALRDVLGDKSLSVAVGVQKNLLFVTIAPSLDHINGPGKGPLLIDHEKLAPLRQSVAEGKELASVFWMSDKAAIYQHESLLNTLDNVIGMLRGISPGADMDADLDDLFDEVEEFSGELKTDFARMFPRPGAWLSWSFLADEGVEGYARSWTEPRFLDGSKPLDILDHVGESPFLVYASRDHDSEIQFDIMRKWGRKTFDLIEKYVPRFIEDDKEAEEASTFIAGLRPILSDFAAATSDDLMPATREGAYALVIDLTSTSTQWQGDLPLAREPLPAPSIGLVLEITDREKVLSAGRRYLAATDRAVELIRDMPRSGIPDEIRIEPPQHKTTDTGDLYYYEMPGEARLDASLAPNALLGDRLLVLSTSTDQSARLMASAKPEFDGPLAEKRIEPLVSAVWFHHAELVDAAWAWGRYGIDVAEQQGHRLDLTFDGENDDLDFTEAELREGIESVVDLLKCLESYSSVTWLEGDVQVTHYLWRFRDVPPAR